MVEAAEVVRELMLDGLQWRHAWVSWVELIQNTRHPDLGTDIKPMPPGKARDDIYASESKI